VFHRHDPLAADADLLRKGFLVQPELHSAVPDKGSVIGRRSDEHGSLPPFSEGLRTTTHHQSQRSMTSEDIYER
jgi:hypothetical protein